MSAKEILIREYRNSDCKDLVELFHQTVHSVNAKDYSDKQLNVWAPDNVDLVDWNKSLCEHFSLVAIKERMIVGFGDIDRTGYLDRLFVHQDYQNQGIATAICDRLEHEFAVRKVVTQASLTAKTFFLHRGYKVVKKATSIKIKRLVDKLPYGKGVVT